MDVFKGWKKKKMGGLTKAIPYYVYDGYEAWPIIPPYTEKDIVIPEKMEWGRVDEIGWNGRADWTREVKYMSEGEEKDEYVKNRLAEEVIIKEEIKRLDELWEKEK